jgi:hypothetical protein
MTAITQERMKGLLGVMVRRHARHDRPNHPVGQLIAEEARGLRGSGSAPVGLTTYAVNDDANRELVDRLYRRFLLPRHATVEVAADESVVFESVR